ncbi:MULTISPECIES: helix-turn-helix transcriptional regulator [unclassified Bradyrhizobium]|uniref:helix-turn-helix domain-containing protein n=1 Tax=unclassified Bradyrhizobium TaxID=2631580 RepID=UPI001CD48F1A|nr:MULTISPECIES: helix-turn-helix transcriptional regulator [unclassified Bradyrhizobium]
MNEAKSGGWLGHVVKATPSSAPACSRSIQSDTRPAAAQQTAAVEETRIAFGKFVNLMRRRRGFSMERLAEVAELDASELLVIEDDVHYVPEPRTVFKLAQTFADA